MNTMAQLKDYFRNRQMLDAIGGDQPFVTISRQAGAGGHTLAREIVRQVDAKLPEVSRGWDVFDHKLCLVLAQDPEFQVSFDTLLKEEYRSELNSFLDDLISGRAAQYSTCKRLFEVVRILALIGRVVIVGRAANCLTADLPLGVRIRLVAGEETRVSGMMKLLDISRDEAVRMVHTQDRDRSRLLHDYFGCNIDDPLQYDAAFNSDTMRIEEIASAVVDMVALKLRRFPGVRA